MKLFRSLGMVLLAAVAASCEARKPAPAPSTAATSALRKNS